jgi:hypothetical protein
MRMFADTSEWQVRTRLTSFVERGRGTARPSCALRIQTDPFAYTEYLSLGERSAQEIRQWSVDAAL